jgi:hypothetical protein
MNKDNLRRMAEYIATVPQELFDMWAYRNEEDLREHNCKTVGCVIGHCTILDDWKNIPRDEDGDILFGEWSEIFTGLNIDSELWDWCFNYKWTPIDNTPIGASKRILWLIENGLPDDWEQQMNGEKPLCYI